MLVSNRASAVHLAFVVNIKAAYLALAKLMYQRQREEILANTAKLFCS